MNAVCAFAIVGLVSLRWMLEFERPLNWRWNEWTVEESVSVELLQYSIKLVMMMRDVKATCPGGSVVSLGGKEGQNKVWLKQNKKKNELMMIKTSVRSTCSNRQTACCCDLPLSLQAKGEGRDHQQGERGLRCRSMCSE